MVSLETVRAKLMRIGCDTGGGLAFSSCDRTRNANACYASSAFAKMTRAFPHPSPLYRERRHSINAVWIAGKKRKWSAYADKQSLVERAGSKKAHQVRMMLSPWACSECTCPICYTPRSTLPSSSILAPPVTASVIRSVHNRDENVAGKRDPAENAFNALSKRQRIGEISSMIVPTVGMNMWVRWDGLENLDAWFEAARPSKASKLQCQWIKVSNVNERRPGFKINEHFSCNHSAYMPALNEMKTIIEYGKNISAAERKACVELLLFTAKQRIDVRQASG
jgi:hypothetical protein